MTVTGPNASAIPLAALFFSDIIANRIYKWSDETSLSIFLENTAGANGLYFDDEGNIIVCEGSKGRVVSINTSGEYTVIANEYNSLQFNEPNDLWVAPDGSIYFSDPVYNSDLIQDGEHVYHISADRTTISRVISDLVKPNGLIGTPDGTTLYVTDHSDNKTFKYTINEDGSLSDKQLFAPIGADGMTIDSLGNIYLACDDILIFSSEGELIETIEVPDRPTNTCFLGSAGKTLFITTMTSVYSLQMNVSGCF